MIEVEKKFILTAESAKKLTANAMFVSEKIMRDMYYDNVDFSLTKKDWWLRDRDGKWELKTPLHNGIHRVADQYKEIVDEKEICTVLSLPPGNSLASTLEQHGYRIFCVCSTRRKKYTHGDFTIDLDIVDFGDFIYTVAEIEIMVSHESAIPHATDQILAFAKDIGLESAPVRGKVIEYLRRMKPEHYHTLVDAGVAW